MTVRKALDVTLEPDATASQAFIVIVGECTEHWSANVDGVLRDRDPEALHQTRVGVRRLRSAFSLFRRTVEDDAQLAWVSSEIRDLVVPFGVARDLDVLLSGPLVAQLAPNQLEDLRAVREAAYDVVIEVLESAAWRDGWRHVDRFLSHAPWGLDPDPPVREVAGEALERRWGRVLRQADRISKLSAREQHRVRIEAKKLRYGCQFFASLYAADPGTDPGAGPAPDTGSGNGNGSGKRRQAATPPLEFAEKVSLLQDALGALNDASAARKRLATVGVKLPRADEKALVADVAAAYDEVSALRPFWR